MANTCPQIKDAGKITNPITPQGCQECLKTGDSWVHLRLCLECGHVGCCDNSKNKHATRHFHQTGHPVIISSLQLPQGIFMVLILCILSSFKSCSDRLEGLVS